MGRGRLFIVLVAVIVVGAGTAVADPSGGVTDDPSGVEDHAAGLDGSGISTVKLYLGDQPASSPGARNSRNVSPVGALRGGPAEYDTGVVADVAGYKNLAFLGKWREACPGTGVDIIHQAGGQVPAGVGDVLAQARWPSFRGC